MGTNPFYIPEASAPPLELFDEGGTTGFPIRIAAPVPPPTSPSKKGYNSEAVQDISETAADSQMFQQIRTNHERSRATAAGVAALAIGFMVGGPIIALVAGGGTTYLAARKKNGFAGDVARAVGDVALTAGNKARDINEKHQVVERTKVATQLAVIKAKDINVRHDISNKAKSSALIVYRGAARYNRKHRVLEKVTKAVKKVFRLAWRRIQATNDRPPKQGYGSAVVY